MKIFTLTRALLSMSVAATLSACGGGTEPENEGPTQTLAVNQLATVVTGQAATAQQVAAQDAAAARPAVYGPNQPVPDCQPENCSGLRIIDANAEEYRLQTMERKQREQAQGGV